ncbi:MAG: septum formation initiator family protein [Muribaculaceae bacterium]|nr:septum formation initiator family protein [Muribaculaceae bacterium]
MSSFSRKTAYWIKRCANIPLLIIGAFFIGILLLNDDASVTQSMAFEKEIVRLKKEIKENKDSAQYYRNRRLAIERGDDALEYIAREQYHMKRPTEDVFLLVAPSR